MATKMLNLLVHAGPASESRTYVLVGRDAPQVITPSDQQPNANIIRVPDSLTDTRSITDWLTLLLRPELERISGVLGTPVDAGLPSPIPTATALAATDSRAPELASGTTNDEQMSCSQSLTAPAATRTDTKEAPLTGPTCPTHVAPGRNDGSGGSAAPQPPLYPDYRGALRELRKLASWHGPSHRDVKQLLEQLARHPRHDPSREKEAIEEGLAIREEIAALEKVAKDMSLPDRSFEEAAARFLKYRPALSGKVDKIRTRRHSIRRNIREARSGQPLTSVTAGARSHRINDLAPRPAWSLYIDETGQDFSAGSVSGKHSGRMVGVLFPTSPQPVRPAAVFHGADTAAGDVDAMVQRVLDTESGVFGIGTQGLPPTAGDRWVSGVIELVHWTARLLPMDGPTVLNVAIEQRGDFTQAVSWQLLEATILRDLVGRDAVRYRDFALHVSAFRKQDETLLGYADAIAYTWGSTSPQSRARLKASCLRGTCLVEGDASELRKAWDALSDGEFIDGATWSSVVNSPDAEAPSSITAVLLDRLGCSTKENVVLWRRLLDHTLAHLDSKAVHLPRLRQEISWLDRYRPSDAQLPKTVALAAAVGRLAAANHDGRTSDEEDARIESLAQEIRDERPDLACLADLHRCVLATNRFDFDAAERALAAWRDVPVAVPGLQMWGRVQSSLGQIAAFRGEYSRALDHFDVALAAFQRLSDPSVSEAESRQSGTYAAIAAMDSPSVSDAEVRTRMSRVLSLDPDRVRWLATDMGVANRYAHHLLVRFLAVRPDPVMLDTYLSVRSDWAYGEGHPWPLIDAYRAHWLLNVDQERAAELARRAVESAFAPGSGATVVLIGIAIAKGLRTVVGLPTLPGDQLAALRNAFPGAAAMLGALDTVAPSDSLPAVLSSVLPFNFR